MDTTGHSFGSSGSNYANMATTNNNINNNSYSYTLADQITQGKQLFERVWDPPLSCQRRAVNFPISGTSFFPLELSSRDYMNRIMNVLSCHFRPVLKQYSDSSEAGGSSLRKRSGSLRRESLLSFTFDPASLNPESNAGHAAAGAGAVADREGNRNGNDDEEEEETRAAEYNKIIRKLLDVLFPDVLNDLQFEKALFVEKNSKLWCPPTHANSTTNVHHNIAEEACRAKNLVKSAEMLLSSYATLYMQSMVSDVGSNLSGDTNLAVLFSCAKEVLQLLGSHVTATGTSTSSSSSLAIYALCELEQQLKLHASFKNQRMKSLGWTWGENNGRRRSSGNNKGGMISIDDDATAAAAAGGGGGGGGAGKVGAEEGDIDDLMLASHLGFEEENILEKFEESKTQLQSLLEPPSAALIHLLSRLVAISEDLHVIMGAQSDNGEYAEAQRLRDIVAAIEGTLDGEEEGGSHRRLLDTVQNCCADALLLREELKREEERCKRTDLSRSQHCAESSRQMTLLFDSLACIAARTAFTGRKDIIDKISREGTFFITSDFIFSYHPQRNSAAAFATSSSASSSHSAVQPLVGMPISGLVLRTQSAAILASMLKWPELAMFNPTAAAADSMGNVYDGFDNGRVSALASSYGAPLSPSLLAVSSYPNSPLQQQHQTSGGGGGGRTSNNYDYNSPSPRRGPMMRSSTSGSASPYGNNGRSPAVSALGTVGGGTGRGGGGGGGYFFPPSPSSSPAPSTPNRTTTRRTTPPMNYTPLNTNSGMMMNQSINSFNSYVNDYGSSSSSAAPGGGFSPEILDVLMAFDSLQKQLLLLRPPKAVAHTCLVQRLMGMRGDLSSLIDMCNKTANFVEADRLRTLCAAVDGALDADDTETLPKAIEQNATLQSSMIQHATSSSSNALSALHVSQAVEANMNVVGGRGRRRLDHLSLLLSEVRQGIKDLQRLVVKARIHRDFTGAAALDEVAKDLTTSVTYLEKCLVPFSFLNDDEYFEVKERVAREGPAFITADFLFQFSAMVPVPGGRQSASDSCVQRSEELNNVLSVHTVGSLALISGCGAVLRYIRSKWPGLTALGENTHQGDAERDSLMLVGGGKLDSSAAQGPVNFNDVSELRSLGFDPIALKAAGFSDVDILTAGFTAAQLKAAGFGADGLSIAATYSPYRSKQGNSSSSSNNNNQQLQASSSSSSSSSLSLASPRKNGAGFQFAGGMVDSSVLRAVLSEDEQQIVALRLLFEATGGIYNGSGDSNPKKGGSRTGASWRATNGWQQLYDVQKHNAPVGYESGASAANRARAERYMLGSLLGVNYDAANSAVLRISLIDNHLQGFLPSEIGFLTHLTHLVLSDNALKGEIPESIGLLSNLDTLVLDGNAFTGEIPKSLKNLRNLSVLRLERNNLQGPIPAVLCALSRLRRLDLSANNLSGPLPLRIGNMTSLQELILHHNQLNGPLPEAIGASLTSLTCLLLNNNRLSGAVPQSWGRLQRLTALQLQDNAGIAVDRLLLQRALPKCRIKL